MPVGSLKKVNLVRFKKNQVPLKRKVPKRKVLKRKDLKKNYGIDEEHITQIFNATKSELKKAYNADDPNYSKDISILNNKLKKCKGLFIPNNDLSNVYRDLYTIDGNKIDGYDIPDDKELNILKLDNEQKKYIEHEIYTLIKIKYNFIHKCRFSFVVPKIRIFQRN